MRILPLQKLLSLAVVMCASVLAFAQPANDDCTTADLLVVGADAATCVPVDGDTRGTVDSRFVEDRPTACSVVWVADDVWYTFETGAETPQFGITVEVRLDGTPEGLTEHGLAIYEDGCDGDNDPILCNVGDNGVRSLAYPPQCLEPNSTYLVRVWSAPDTTVNSGTFSICAYESDSFDTGGGSSTARIIFEETFDDGLGVFTSVPESQSLDIATGEMLDNEWLWSNTGCFPNVFGTEECLIRAELACQEVGVVGVPAGFYQSERDGDPGNVGAPPYPDVLTSLVSPSIDLSKETCVNLTWLESVRGLNGGTISRFGPAVQYSLDGGVTWISPSQSIGSADVSTNYGGNLTVNERQNANVRSVPLLGAEGNPDVRVRFRYDGDFYYWIIDDVRIVVGEAFDLVAQENFFARAVSNPMSIHQVDSYDFLIDIANLACEDQTNVNVNVTGVNSAGAAVYSGDLAYGTIESDSLAENQPFLQPFTPAEAVDTYTFTYTATSDADDDLSNNERTFQAEVVDELMFRKEDGIQTGTLGPNTGAFFTVGDPFNWEMGNIFYASNANSINGERLAFNTVSFQLANADELAGERLTVTLYEIADINFDGILDLTDPNETEIRTVGLSQYDVVGIETGMITVELDPFSTNPAFPATLDLSANTHYMAAIRSNLTPNSQATIDGIAMNFADSDVYDYSAALFNSRQTANNDLTRIRYAHGFAISAEGFFRIIPSTTGDLTTGNFPEDRAPIIRLGFEELPPIATVEINQNIDIAIAPNPASSNITLDLSIEEATDMEISVINLVGQTMISKSFDKVTDLRENFDVSRLASGVYMIHIDTKNGVQTKKFVVSN